MTEEERDDLDRELEIRFATNRMLELEIEVQQRRTEWRKAQEEQADAMRRVLSEWQDCVKATERTQANLDETMRSWRASRKRLELLTGL